MMASTYRGRIRARAPTQTHRMKADALSLGIGVLAGVIHPLVQVRSPAIADNEPVRK